MGKNAVTLYAEIHSRQSQLRRAKYAWRKLGHRRQLRVQSGEARRPYVAGTNQQLIPGSDRWPRRSEVRREKISLPGQSGKSADHALLPRGYAIQNARGYHQSRRAAEMRLNRNGEHRL